MKTKTSLIAASTVALALVVSACGRTAPVLPAPDGAVSLSSFAAQLRSSSSVSSVMTTTTSTSSVSVISRSSSSVSTVRVQASSSVAGVNEPESVVTKGSL